MGGAWSTSRPGRFTPGNRWQGGPQMYTVCGVTTLHCDRVSEKALCTCARRVLHSTASGKFIHIQVSGYLLAAPSASSTMLALQEEGPWYPLIHSDLHSNLRAASNRFTGTYRTLCIQYMTQYSFSHSSMKSV